jgi:hypothetical protein
MWLTAAAFDKLPGCTGQPAILRVESNGAVPETIVLIIRNNVITVNLAYYGMLPAIMCLFSGSLLTTCFVNLLKRSFVWHGNERKCMSSDYLD